MRDKDDPEMFIKYLEVALTRRKIPRDVRSRGENTDGDDSTFDDIVAAMTGCMAMTFASTAEALFAPVEETDKAKPRVVADKIKRTKKLLQEAETEEEMIDNFQ